jgi:hypothetical protein
MELIRSREKFTCNDGFLMSAYITRPRASTRVPGILFIYEAFGMNQEMIRIADEALEKINRQANEMPLDSGTAMVQ